MVPNPQILCDFLKAMSTNYYDENAELFFDATIDVDMAPLYDRFLPRVRAGGCILDAGCGSGRDTKVFSDRGYSVTAFDGSLEMVRMAMEHAQQAVEHLTFLEMDYQALFDGIWASASLLHVPDKDWVEVLERFGNALKPGGVWYLSFKMGEEAREAAGRLFRDHTADTLRESLALKPDLELVESWCTPDLRAGRAHELWLNALVCRQPEGL